MQAFLCKPSSVWPTQPVKTRLREVFCFLKCRHSVAWCCCAAPFCLFLSFNWHQHFPSRLFILFFCKWKCSLQICEAPSFIQGCTSHVYQLTPYWWCSCFNSEVHLVLGWVENFKAMLQKLNDSFWIDVLLLWWVKEGSCQCGSNCD